MIQAADHVALSVSDMQRSERFYCDLFGFEVRRRLAADTALPLAAVIGVEGASADIAHLYLGDFMLELFEYQQPRGAAIAADRGQADHGYNHFGFRVTEIHAETARLRAAGVRFLSDPVEFRPGVWIVYFSGPDGEIGELRQA